MSVFLKENEQVLTLEDEEKVQWFRFKHLWKACGVKLPRVFKHVECPLFQKWLMLLYRTVNWSDWNFGSFFVDRSWVFPLLGKMDPFVKQKKNQSKSKSKSKSENDTEIHKKKGEKQKETTLDSESARQLAHWMQKYEQDQTELTQSSQSTQSTQPPANHAWIALLQEQSCILWLTRMFSFWLIMCSCENEMDADAEKEMRVFLLFLLG